MLNTVSPLTLKSATYAQLLDKLQYSQNCTQSKVCHHELHVEGRDTQSCSSMPLLGRAQGHWNTGLCLARGDIFDL